MGPYMEREDVWCFCGLPLFALVIIFREFFPTLSRGNNAYESTRHRAEAVIKTNF